MVKLKDYVPAYPIKDCPYTIGGEEQGKCGPLFLNSGLKFTNVFARICAPTDVVHLQGDKIKAGEGGCSGDSLRSFAASHLGQCLEKQGTPESALGACVPWCVDADNDGFFAPASNSSVPLLGTSVGDCNDSDPGVGNGSYSTTNGKCGCFPKVESCLDSIDNDCDGKADCADSDCATACASTCPKNLLDGKFCAKNPDIKGCSLAGNSEKLLNYKDGATELVKDCGSVGCVVEASGKADHCATGKEICGNGLDDDGNGCTDADDKTCGSCDSKQCGTTKCGQLCDNLCQFPQSCNEKTEKCEQCQPNCAGKTCGPDGCGKMCGTCTGVCNSGSCCEPNCAGTVCGDNGCGQPCAECPGGAKCNADGTCPKDTSVCKEWDFAASNSTLGWSVPANHGKSKGNTPPNNDWLVSPSKEDPQIDVQNIAVNGALCNHLAAVMSTNCKMNKACIYFRTKNKVIANGVTIDCTKLNEDYKVCDQTCAANVVWCDAKFDLSENPCWTGGGDVVEIRFDYVDAYDEPGPECPAGNSGDAGFENIKLYHWGNQCKEGTQPEVCYGVGPVSGIKGACSAGVRFCEQGEWSPCVGEVKPKPEVCDGKDNDCDGQTDEDEDAQMCISFFVDNDGDGYGSFSKCLCAKSGKYQATSGGDCDDNNAQVNPGKNEQCNNLDDNCNSSIDEGAIAACDDGLPCTSDNCSAGTCDHQLQDGQCKIAGACQTSGTQQPGQPCFKCDPTQSIASWSPSSGNACDDNDACTKNDTCNNGKCAGSGTCDECQADSDCKDDSDLCNGKPICDVAVNPKKCKPNAKDVVVCQTSKDTTCQKTVCSAATGACALKNAIDGAACDADGSLCTTNDACKTGQCVAGAPLICTDDNPCTDSGCDPAKGCTVTNNMDSCNDNNACTVGDVCANGTCKSGTSKPCVDDNPCTKDGCDPAKGCTNLNLPSGTSCGNPNCVGLSYSATPTCASGTCMQPATMSCDDVNPCTNDACAAAAGCSHLPSIEVCDDGNACTLIDKCTMGACQGTNPKACSDSNSCTADTCDKIKGCLYQALADGAMCTASACDGSSYVAAAVCKAGTCQSPLSPVSCDDQNACTTDACAPGQGCTHSAATGDCSDSNACTIGDKCQSGKCAPGVPPQSNRDRPHRRVTYTARRFPCPVVPVVSTPPSRKSLSSKST